MNIQDYYEQQGSGSPIVFIHGSYATSATWKKMIASLAKQHHCISIKLPGHGGTADPSDFDAPTIETELAIIEHIVADLCDQPIHLVGHSYGGVVALALALKGSVPLSQLSLFEPVTTWVFNATNDSTMSAELDQFLQHYRHDAERGVPYACGQVIEFWGGKGAFNSLPEFIRDGMVPLTQNNLRHWDICTKSPYHIEDLQQLTVATRVICGDQSHPALRSIAQHLCDNIPNCSSHIIHGATHFLVTSHTDECLTAMTQ